MEVGVYKGGTSAFISLAAARLGNAAQKHYAIDTFVGHLPEDIRDDGIHQAGRFSDVSYDEVSNYLRRVSGHNVVIKGNFEEATKELVDEKFSLVHLDVDLRYPTLQYLEFLNSKIPPGGIIIVDDYLAPKCPGIYRSVCNFLECHQNSYHVWAPPTEQVILTKVR